MELETHEIRYDEYCHKCKYFKTKEHDEPCHECLETSEGFESKKPIKFEEK